MVLLKKNNKVVVVKVENSSVNRSSTSRIGLFVLIMLAIVSVDSLRNISIAAQYGPSLIFFYSIAAVGFFFPLAFVASNLAKEFPVTGGSFVWIDAAFGRKLGYISIWLQWVYNMVWYPTIFVFISSTFANLIYPNLEHSKLFVLSISFIIFWLLGFLHSFGIRAVGWMGTFGAIIGTLVPMFILIVIAAIWLLVGHNSATYISWHALIPDVHGLKNLAYFSTILFSLLGIEVIAMHASNIKKPEKTYPCALFISSIIIIITLVLSSVSLCVILPAHDISLVNGTMDVFELFFAKWHFQLGAKLAGICVIVGGLAIASSWMIGLARGLHAAIKSSGHFVWLHKLNRSGMPVRVLLVQAVVYSVLLSTFFLFGSINASYWMLSALTAQFALLYYIILFLAAIKLNKQKYGKNISVWVCVPSMIAILTCVAGIIAGFLPPSEVPQGKILSYELFLIFGFIVMVLLPSFVIRTWRKIKNF